MSCGSGGAACGRELQKCCVQHREVRECVCRSEVSERRERYRKARGQVVAW